MFVSIAITGEAVGASYYAHVECCGQIKTICIDGWQTQRLTFELNPQPKCTASPKQRKRKATKQEEDAASIHGGKRHKGSGALPHSKSDASVRHRYRMECKHSAGVGIRVTRADLDKLRSECEPGQVPVFLIQYNEPTTLKTQDEWVMVPKTEWERHLATEHK